MSEYTEIVQAVFDNTDFVAFACDRTGRVTLAEGKGMEALGGRERFLGINVFAFFGEDSDVSRAVRRALAGEAFATQLAVGKRWLEARYAPLRSGGEVTGAVGITLDVTDRVVAQEAVGRQTERMREQSELLDLARDAILVRKLDGTLTYWNRSAERMYGYTAEEALGRVSHVLLKTVFPAELRDIDQRLTSEDFWEGELTHRRGDGEEVIVASRWVLRRDAAGAPLDVFEINTDITARKAAEEEHARRQQEIIRAQAHAIAELSTPLIPLTDEVLVMPLIGMMDSVRARQVMDNLLSGLAAARGRVAILDITGVPVVDTATANALIQAAQAARLLGAEVVLTGIRPEVAQTLVTIDARLDSITTRGTLQSGIEFALGRRRLGGA